MAGFDTRCFHLSNIHFLVFWMILCVLVGSYYHCCCYFEETTVEAIFVWHRFWRGANAAAKKNPLPPLDWKITVTVAKAERNVGGTHSAAKKQSRTLFFVFVSHFVRKSAWNLASCYYSNCCLSAATFASQRLPLLL